MESRLHHPIEDEFRLFRSFWYQECGKGGEEGHGQWLWHELETEEDDERI